MITSFERQQKIKIQYQLCNKYGIQNEQEKVEYNDSFKERSNYDCW